MRTMPLFGGLLLGVLLLPLVQAEEPAKTLQGMPLLFVDGFESGSAANWEPSDPKAWQVVKQVPNHVYSQFKQSDVKTPVRSPFNRALIKGVVVGDCVLEARLQSTVKDYGHRDLCLFFGYQDPAHMYYVHLGKQADPHAHSIFLVNDAPRISIAKKRTDGVNWDDGWHTVRVVRKVEAGTIAVYFDDMNTPIMSAEDKTFAWGQVGIGSFDDTGNFDDIRVWGVRATPAGRAAGVPLRLQLRTRIEPFKGSNLWDEVNLTKELPSSETAILICDMWDNHWCQAAAKRCEGLAHRMEPVLAAARAKGVVIIHAPSDCMDFYRDAPQRKRLTELAKTEPPKPLELPEPALPVDAAAGGCDDASPAKSYKAWTRQHPALTIGDQDWITDNGKEVYRLLHQRGVRNLILMGVHTNMCVLGRSFGIRQMTRWGIRCILVRDLTDAMYDPRAAPFVSHEEGTELVIQHIEKYWCPTLLSADLLRKP